MNTALIGCVQMPCTMGITGDDQVARDPLAKAVGRDDYLGRGVEGPSTAADLATRGAWRALWVILDRQPAEDDG